MNKDRERFEAWRKSGSNWCYVELPEDAFEIWKAAEAAAIEWCIQAIRNERATGSDLARVNPDYNIALDDAELAVRALKGS